MTDKDHFPLVSTIITTYNREEELKRAVKSVESQSYPNLELVVVDDHSDQSPRHVLSRINSDRFADVIFIRHDINKGVSAARNTGISESTGELIAFLDDDDIWKPEKIERQVSKFHNTSEAGAIYTGAKSVDSSGSIITVQRPTRSGNLTKDLLCDHGIWFPTLLVERSIVEKVGGFDEEMLMREDVEWVTRLSQHTRFAVVPDPLLVTFRGDEHNQKSDDIDAKMKYGNQQLIEQQREIASEYGLVFRRKFTGYSRFKIGREALSGGRPELAREYLTGAVIAWPFKLQFYIFLLVSLLGRRWYFKLRALKRNASGGRHRIKEFLNSL
jgi:glycosyltransferase involved in cell wall biosynthesis